MSKKRFVGVSFIETVRVGKRTFAFGIYNDHKVGRIPFAGLSEKHPVDNDNPTRGRNLAIARALETLGKQIEKREWAKIKTNYAPVKAKKIGPKEVAALKTAGKDIHEARAKAREAKNVKESTKAGK